MLRESQQIRGAELRASDGTIGHVKDLYFDDVRWVVRYLVVNTGGWLSGREVLISPGVVAGPFEPAGCLPVNLSREQVKHSPAVDTAGPVTREHEQELSRHYGWPSMWIAPGLAFAGMAAPIVGVAGPMSMPPVATPADSAPEVAPEPETESHLRSANTVTGYDVQASDGAIGHVEELLVDDADWSIRYLVIDTRNWLPGRHVILAPQWTERISWDERAVHVALRRDSVKSSPAYDRTNQPDQDYEARLREHYARTR